MQQTTLSHRPINFKKERSFGDKLNATFAFLSQNVHPVGKNVLLIAGPFALLCGIFYGIYQSYTFGAAVTGSDTSGIYTSENLPVLIISIIGMLLFSLVAGAMVVAIILRHIRMYVREGHTRIRTGEMWNTIWKDFFNALGTTIILIGGFFVMCLLAGIFIGFLFAFSGMGGAASGVAMGLAVLLVFLFFGLVFPPMLLLYPIRSMEKVGLFAAVGRMFRLVSGKWWSTLGIVMVSLIMQSFLSMVFAIPMYGLLFLKAFHSEGIEVGMSSSGSLYDVLLSASSGVFMVGSFALYSIIIVAVTFQYYNLVERKEASGLLERLEGFGKAQPAPEEEDEHY